MAGRKLDALRADSLSFSQLKARRDHVVVSDALFRPTDISDGRGDAAKAERLLGWKAGLRMKQVVSEMVRAELELARSRQQ